VVWGLLVLGTIFVVESFLRLPFLSRVKSLKILLDKISWVLKSSSVSDHWKEKILPVYAWQLFTNSIVLFALVFIGILPMILLATLAELFNIPLLPLISSLPGILASTVLAVIYIFVKRRVIPD
jgi:hypothetical protein